MKRMLKFKEFSAKLDQYAALQEMVKLSEEMGLYDEVNEGGAYGHLKHPFEDFELTMGDLHKMIQDTINGAFGPENFVQEKTDGQQLSISWKNGKVIAARNKSHLKNAGENAMDIAGVAQLFAGRGDIETVYNAAMEDLSASISALSDKDRTRIFEEGKKFASLEIITPVTQNTVPYGLNMLVFHGVLEYDVDGNVMDEDKQSGRDLGKLIADANQSAQKTFFVRGPQDMDIKPFPNTAKRSSYYEKKFKEILQSCSLNDASTVYDYALGMGRNVLNDEADKAGIKLPATSIDGLASRIADINKAYTAPMIKKELGPDADWYTNLEKKQGKALKRRVFAPLESLFIEVGTEFMKNMSSYLSANPTEAAEAMRKEIDKTIATLRSNGGPEEIEKLEHELSRVTAAGGMENIVPTEGITFVFKGKLYKYTGIFAPLHQIRSMLAYKK
jgi:hypothetical protein